MSTEYNRVMLDLETLGTRPGCAVLSVGAVFFSSTLPQWKGPTFYVALNRKSNVAAGLREDPNTLAWWERQSVAARDVLIQEADGEDLRPALDGFSTWLRFNAADPKSVQVWGNGADFDNPILSAAYDAADLSQPWGAYNGRCYRTLKALYPWVKRPARQGVHHNALDDAVFQAEHAVAMLREVRAHT